MLHVNLLNTGIKSILFIHSLCALQSSSLDCIPSSKPSDSHGYIEPGFNDYVKDLHSVARSDYVAWRKAGNSGMVLLVEI